jgi:Circadian oscillating protein COP23
MDKRITKSLNLLSLLAASLLVGATGHLTVQPSFAQSITFVCDTSGSSPRTLIHTTQRVILLVRWMHSLGGHDPLKRCKEVSARFQNLQQEGSLRFITSGRLNGENIICVASELNGPCLPNGLLFTVKPGDSPRRILNQALPCSFELPRPFLLEEVTPKIYISMDDLINGRCSSPTTP